MDFKLPGIEQLVGDKELSQVVFKRSDIDSAAAAFEQSLVQLCVLQFSHMPRKEIEAIVFPFVLTTLAAYLADILIDDDTDDEANVHLFCHMLLDISGDVAKDKKAKLKPH